MRRPVTTKTLQCEGFIDRCSNTRGQTISERKANRKANAVLSDFKHISGDLRLQIMQSYCGSFYGSQLWDLSNKYIDRLSISRRKSVRKTLNIPVITHFVYFGLPPICECLPLNV